jgi:glycerol-3-phosphate dehydrogenase (NAD(P)+)
MRAVLREASGMLDPGAALILAAKGIENDTLATMTTVAVEETSLSPCAVLSGPSFALEVARGDPTAVVVACEDLDRASALQQEISHGGLRLYTNADVAGVQLAGALKNVFAIAAGVITGLGLGSNTVAALITRSLAEMRRLGSAAGGRRETFDGLAGLGDLVLTCTGALSRNRRLGEQLGRGLSMDEALSGMTQVAEGVRTSLSAKDLASQHSVEMPIVDQVHAVLHLGRSPREAISELMARRLRGEEDA